MGEQAAPADMTSLTNLLLEMRKEQLEMKADLAKVMKKGGEESEPGEPSKKKEEEFEVNEEESEIMEVEFKLKEQSG